MRWWYISKSFKSYLGKDSAYEFIYKYCSDLVKKQFNKEVAMIKKVLISMWI